MKQKYHGLNFPKPQIRLYEGHGRELTQPGFMLGAVKIEYIHSRVHVLLSLSLSIYVYIYIYTHVYVCVYTLYIYIYIYIYIHVFSKAYTHTNKNVYTHEYVCIYTYNRGTCICIHICAYIYIYIHSYIYIYAYIPGVSYSNCKSQAIGQPSTQPHLVGSAAALQQLQPEFRVFLVFFCSSFCFR